MLTSEDSPMDIDIDALLDSSSAPLADPYFNDDVASLTTWWMNERCAPEILQYQDMLVSQLIEMLNAQTENIEPGRDDDDPDKAFLVVLYQQEMERIKFVIRGYLRTRLVKIQQHPLHLLRDESSRSRLSEEEIIFCEKFQEILEAHYTKSCLSDFPSFLKRLDDDAGDLHMVSKPDLDDSVIIRVQQSIGAFHLAYSKDTIEMNAGDQYILRYSAVKNLIEDGKVELV
ncbi:hypothetical protein DFS34DRAFT_272852 [Phlyctochytrium arcticum]|nr:hypothetical protein DFS34DRAFT_272852 [Phlyctochytrium arcticum]